MSWATHSPTCTTRTTAARRLAEFYATLRHDGILILDQRNYDAILDHQIEPSHNYYYCGDNVRATPEHVDETPGPLPLRVSWGFRLPPQHVSLAQELCPQRLLREVGFQRITTYGDFKETYREAEPDFFVHVAEKRYIEGGEE